MESKHKQDDDVDITPSIMYLIMYNIVQALGWTYLTVTTTQYYLEFGHVGLYDTGKLALNIFQTLAILEVIHPMLGLVKTNVVLTAFQVMSRLFLTWGVTYSIPKVQDNIGVTMFILAWSFTEIIRYSYYACGQVKTIPYLLQWCRYTFFIILYPIGVTGELLTVYAALPYIKNSGIYSVSMPNRANMGFSYHAMCIVAMFMYIPIFPQLYMHMFAQRKKIIGGAKGTKAA